MLKNLLSTFVLAMMMLFAINSQVSAYNVAVVLDTPAGTFSDPEKVYATLQTSLDNIFNDSSKYDIMPLGESDAYVQIYREEKGVEVDTDSLGQDAGRDFTFKKSDINNICKHFGTPYVIYARVTSTAPRFSGGFITASQKVNVTLDFRVWSDAKGDFVYTKRAMATGTSTTVYAGGIGSASHAIEKGLKKDLQQIEKEADKIRTSMI